jgi:hypothetical protein
MKNKKKFKLGVVEITTRANGFPKGLILKRKVTTQEAKYILGALLVFVLATRDDFDCVSDYRDRLTEYTNTVNLWLKGGLDDDSIAELSCECSEEQLGLMNMIPILDYLKKKGVIE